MSGRDAAPFPIDGWNPADSPGGKADPMIDEWGISDGYHDIAGRWHETSPATRAALRTAMGPIGPQQPMWFVEQGHTEQLWSACRLQLEDGEDLGLLHFLPADLPPGYHTLTPSDGGPLTRLVVAPPMCPQPQQAWGVAAQVYALWTEHSWGIGDLDDVAALCRSAAAQGAGVALLSPLHAAAPTVPQQDSPYSPSSRCWWNPLLLPIADRRPPAGLAVQPDRLIDRDTVWVAKRAALAERFADHGKSDRAARSEWVRAVGRNLPLFAAWGALAERHGDDWTAWPEKLRRPGPHVLDHVEADEELAGAADFHEWCQWMLHQHVLAAGGDVGLIGDMAVGFSPHGFDAWLFQDLLASGDVRVGAPPDELAPDGQNWNLPPFAPWRLRSAGYQPLIDTLRAVLTGMAGIRIDHVMGLFRQYWALPPEAGGGGAYVYFPAHELLSIVTLEAHRAGAFVIGEDLGTVPPEVPPALAARGILSTKVALLDDRPVDEWPEACCGTITTHDLPTIAGVLAGEGSDEMRTRLVALGSTVEEIHKALLTSPARIRLLTTDDLCETPLRPNVPGTVGPPNWCRPLPLPADQIPATTVAP